MDEPRIGATERKSGRRVGRMPTLPRRGDLLWMGVVSSAEPREDRSVIPWRGTKQIQTGEPFLGGGALLVESG